VFSRHNKKKPSASKSRSAPAMTDARSESVPQSTDQDALNDYLSSSKSSWYESPEQEKKEHFSPPSSPAVELPKDGGFKYSLGTPPGAAHRSDRLGMSLPHGTSVRRGHRRNTSR